MKKLYRWILAGSLLMVASCAQHLYADTTTSRFSLTKPDIGSTNWGPKLNTNFDTIDNAAGISLINTFTSSNTFNSSTWLNAPIYSANGTDAAPSISFAQFQTSGLSITSGPDIHFDIGGSSIVSVTSAGMKFANGSMTLDLSTATVKGSITNNSTTTANGPWSFKNGVSITSMTANLVMSGHSITNLADGVNNTDAVAFEQIKISTWGTYTPTGGFAANSTLSGLFRRVGDSMDIQIKVAFSGTPTITASTVSIPSAYIIDTTKMPATDSDQTVIGEGALIDAGNAFYVGKVMYNSTTNVRIRWESVVGSSVTLSGVTATSPFAFGNGDYILYRFRVPITGWTATSGT